MWWACRSMRRARLQSTAGAAARRSNCACLMRHRTETGRADPIGPGCVEPDEVQSARRGSSMSRISILAATLVAATGIAGAAQAQVNTAVPGPYGAEDGY